MNGSSTSPRVLGKLRRRLAGWLLASSFGQGLAGLAGTLLLALLADALFDLPDGLRASTSAVLATLGLVLLSAAWRRLRNLSASRVAYLYEQRDRGLGSRLTNAVQLSAETSSSPVTEFLRSEAILLGQEEARRLRTWPLARRSFLWATGALAVVGAGWLILVFQAADLFQTVWPRFRDPHGDHPPYSALRLAVTPRGGQVLFGGQFDIRATATGRPVDKLWLVARSASHETRAPMFLAPDRSYFQTLANLREPTEYFVTDGQARSHRFAIGIRLTPQISLVEVTTTFPSYTDLPPRSAKLADEPQALPEGTRIQFRVASNRPLRGGSLTLTPVLGGKPKVVPLARRATPEQVEGEFVLNEAVAFSLQVQDVNGLSSLDGRQGRFHLRPDERPRLIVLEPGRDAVATPKFKVPITVQATDDYGVTRVVWLRGHNRSVERPFSMALTLKDRARQVETKGALDLARLGVKPGDVIEYYFEAADNDPKGPHLTLSKLYRLEVISEEQYQSILKQAAARQALFEHYLRLNQQLQRLAEKARAAKQLEAQNDPSTPAAAKELAEELASLRDEMSKLLAQPKLFDIEDAFRDSLASEQQKLTHLLELARRGSQSPPNPGQPMRELADALSEISQQNDEQVGTPARHLAAVSALVARADSFVKLAHEQALLARLLKKFADRTDALSRLEQLEVQELAHQERRIRDALRRLLESLSELLEAVPDEPAYEPLRADVAKFIAAVGEGRIEDVLAEAAQALGKIDPVAGSALAQSAAEKMDQLIARCQSQQGQAQQCLQARFRPRLSQMNQTLSQVLSAMGVGSAGEGNDGYSMFNNDVGLYGPNQELAGEQGSPRGIGPGSPGKGGAPAGSSVPEPGGSPPAAASRVRLQPNARFPLRYRDLVGDYFRSISESADDDRTAK